MFSIRTKFCFPFELFSIRISKNLITTHDEQKCIFFELSKICACQLTRESRDESSVSSSFFFSAILSTFF